MDSVFIKVPVNEKLPFKSDVYTTSNGQRFYDAKIKKWHIDLFEDKPVSWWMEERTLHTEEQIKEKSKDSYYPHSFEDGANFILNHIKKGG